MIREILKVTTDRQKSCTNMRRKDIRYEIGEKLFLKVSPWDKLMRFGKNGKLSPMLRRYRSDLSHVVSSETIELRPDLTYEEERAEIFAPEVKELWKKKIPFVKVPWRNRKTEEAMWESEEVMRQQYP